MKPNHLLISFMVVVVAALSLILFNIEVTNPGEDFEEPGEFATNQNANQFDRTEDRLIYRGDPPYLTERPILDGNLFVNHTDDFLLIGGANIEQIRYNAVTGAGNRATTSFKNNSIALLMAEEPYIEFSYQEKFYSLQILSRPYFFTMDLRELSESTTSLENRVNLQ